MEFIEIGHVADADLQQVVEVASHKIAVEAGYRRPFRLRRRRNNAKVGTMAAGMRTFASRSAAGGFDCLSPIFNGARRDDRAPCENTASVR